MELFSSCSCQHFISMYPWQIRSIHHGKLRAWTMSILCYGVWQNTFSLIMSFFCIMTIFTFYCHVNFLPCLFVSITMSFFTHHDKNYENGTYNVGRKKNHLPCATLQYILRIEQNGKFYIFLFCNDHMYNVGKFTSLTISISFFTMANFIHGPWKTLFPVSWHYYFMEHGNFSKEGFYIIFYFF